MQRAEELIATFKLPCKKIKRYIYIYIGKLDNFIN